MAPNGRGTGTTAGYVIKGLTWQNSYLKKIILDGFVTFPANTACGVIINCVSDSGHGTIALKVSGSGRTNELTVTTTLRNNAPLIPSAGNVLSFGALDNEGEFTTVTSQMKITNAEESGGEYTLTLVDYNPAIYEYGELPTYKSNITTPPNGRAQTIEQQREYITQGDAEASASGAAQAAVDTVTTGHRFTNVYRLRAPNECLEEIIAKMDDDARNASASISISEDEILLQVDNVEKGLRGLIDIQAGAVTALVEGGGASGQMSLTLNLPAMIDATTRAAMITASTEEKVNAVYALVENTDYYAIKPNASNQAVKALWDDAIAGGLIASQIILSADQINIAGKTIYTSSKTDTVATSAADTAAVAKRNDVAQSLGYLDWAAMASAASQGKTIIDGGLIRTSLIDTDAIKAAQGFFENIDVKDANLYNATIKSLLSVEGDYLYTPTIKPNVINKLRLRGGIRAMFYWHEGTVQFKTDNIDSVTKLDTGVYLVKFNDDSYIADCFGYSLYSSYSPLATWTVPTAAKASGQVTKQFYKIGIVTQIEEPLNNGYKIIQNYTTAIGTNNNNLADFNTHALVFFML